MSHVWTSHVTNMNTSCHMYKWVTSQTLRGLGSVCKHESCALHKVFDQCPWRQIFRQHWWLDSFFFSHSWLDSFFWKNEIWCHSIKVPSSVTWLIQIKFQTIFVTWLSPVTNLVWNLICEYVGMCHGMCVHTYVCVCVCVEVFVRLYVYIHACTCTHTRACVCIYMYIHIQPHTHMYVYVYICIYICIDLYIHVYVYIHVYSYINIYAHIHTSTHIHTHMYIYMCICTATHCYIPSKTEAPRLPLALQHTTTHGNTLQHTATYLHRRKLPNYPILHCNTLQHIATHCDTLQHTATHCNTLQHTATHCNTLQHTFIDGSSQTTSFLSCHP